MLVRRFLFLMVPAAVTMACAGKTPAPPPVCDAACADGIALRSVREMAKVAFNFTFAAPPATVGMHDFTVCCGTGMHGDTATMPPVCPAGGKARVFGTATSNPNVGSTSVMITYVFDQCHYQRMDTDPLQNYDVTLSATLQENGTFAVQPTSTTALVFTSDDVSVAGTVHDPAVDYMESACMLNVTQDGNNISGTMCGRSVGLTL